MNVSKPIIFILMQFYLLHMLVTKSWQYNHGTSNKAKAVEIPINRIALLAVT
jgi:hypothetical protein